jgi:hypothetical protein
MTTTTGKPEGVSPKQQKVQRRRSNRRCKEAEEVLVRAVVHGKRHK